MSQSFFKTGLQNAILLKLARMNEGLDKYSKGNTVGTLGISGHT